MISVYRRPDESELNRNLVQAHIINDAKRLMIRAYIQDHPSAETTKILEIIYSHMTCKEAEEKIKELRAVLMM